MTIFGLRRDPDPTKVVGVIGLVIGIELSMVLTRFTLIQLSSLILLLNACSSKGGSGGDEVGTQGTGGGSAIFSSIAEVNAALDQAIALVSQKKGRRNIVLRYWEDRGSSRDVKFISNPEGILPALIVDPNLTAADVDRFALLDSKLNPGLVGSPLLSIGANVIRRADGDCLQSKDRRHRDASVSSFSKNGKVCVSIGNLTRIPPQALLGEISALLVHEAIHLGGDANEERATAWQQGFLEYFKARFGNGPSPEVAKETISALDESIEIFETLKRIDPSSLNAFAILNLVNRLTDKMQTLPYLFDTEALNVKTAAAKPELVDNYQNAVIKTLETISRSYKIENTQKLSQAGPFSVLSYSVKVDTEERDELERLLRQTHDNFIAYLNQDTEVKSTCVYLSVVQPLWIREALKSPFKRMPGFGCGYDY